MNKINPAIRCAIVGLVSIIIQIFIPDFNCPPMWLFTMFAFAYSISWTIKLSRVQKDPAKTVKHMEERKETSGILQEKYPREQWVKAISETNQEEFRETGSGFL